MTAESTCPACGAPVPASLTRWNDPDPYDACWAVVYLIAGVWAAPHRGGLVPTREIVRGALSELYDTHGEKALRQALSLAAGQPLPHGVPPEGKQECAKLAAALDRQAKA